MHIRRLDHTERAGHPAHNSGVKLVRVTCRRTRLGASCGCGRADAAMRTRRGSAGVSGARFVHGAAKVWGRLVMLARKGSPRLHGTRPRRALAQVLHDERRHDAAWPPAQTAPATESGTAFRRHLRGPPARLPAVRPRASWCAPRAGARVAARLGGPQALHSPTGGGTLGA